MPRLQTVEHQRLADAGDRQTGWRHWGPYISERAWGTVREDYSATGKPWDYFPHDHARSRAYRWNEDGLAGLCNRYQSLCLAVALWNGRDLILKERLFGLSGTEGDHGEDVKEYYFTLTARLPTPEQECCTSIPRWSFPTAGWWTRVNGGDATTRSWR